MKATKKAMIDGLAKKAFESIVDDIPDGVAPSDAAYLIPANEAGRGQTMTGERTPARGRIAIRGRTTGRGRTTTRRRKVVDPFPIVACALALILVIPSARGLARTALADAATAACKSGRLDGSMEFMTMVFARGGERFRQTREIPNERTVESRSFVW